MTFILGNVVAPGKHCTEAVAKSLHPYPHLCRGAEEGEIGLLQPQCPSPVIQLLQKKKKNPYHLILPKQFTN